MFAAEPVVRYVQELRRYTEEVSVGSKQRQIIDASIDAFAAGLERVVPFLDIPDMNAISLKRFMADGIEANVKALSSGMTDAERRPIIHRARLMLKDWLAR